MQKLKPVVVPNMAKFVREVTEHGNIGAMIRRMLALPPLSLVKLMWWNKTNLIRLAKKDFSQAMVLLIQTELLQLPKTSSQTIVLNGQVTDLAVALGSSAIIRGFIVSVKRLGMSAGLQTSNLPSLVKLMAAHKIHALPVFLPFNRYGYEMNPSKAEVEQYAEWLGKEQITALIPKDDAAERRYLATMKIANKIEGWL